RCARGSSANTAICAASTLSSAYASTCNRTFVVRRVVASRRIARERAQRLGRRSPGGRAVRTFRTLRIAGACGREPANVVVATDGFGAMAVGARDDRDAVPVKHAHRVDRRTAPAFADFDQRTDVRGRGRE